LKNKSESDKIKKWNKEGGDNIRYHNLRFDIWLCLLLSVLLCMGAEKVATGLLEDKYKEHKEEHKVEKGQVGGVAGDDLIRAQNIEDLLSNEYFTIESPGIEYRNKGAGFHNGYYLYAITLPSKEKVAARINQESVVSSQSNNLSQKKLTPVLANNGCYNGSEARNWYQLEWSFPGTWINNKTGEISYKEKDTNTWHKERDKFCLPLNAKNVNTNWWNWYMSLKNPGNSTNNSGSYTSKLYKSTCKDITNTAALSTIAGNNLDYNIKASARDFGYFKWNFNIECFYAVNDGSDITNTKKETEKYCTNSPDAYVTRPITNKDMFPSTEEGSSGITNPAETGRIPGYNWTESASIIKSTDYAVNPKELIKKIQDTKDKIYNDDATYLDYEFYLTPSDLRAIKSYGSKSKSSYSDWDASAIRYHKDSGIKGSGIYAYSSPLFRGNGPLATSGAARKLGVVACNNQARSGSCR